MLKSKDQKATNYSTNKQKIVYVILCMKCHVACIYQQRESEANCHNENNLEINYNDR